jgi:hypothetical protein
MSESVAFQGHCGHCTKYPSAHTMAMQPPHATVMRPR